jgi:hypothetical protein
MPAVGVSYTVLAHMFLEGGQDDEEENPYPPPLENGKEGNSRLHWA